MIDKLQVKNIFAAVFEKKVLDELLDLLNKNEVKFWGTAGTVDYVRSKGFKAESVIRGFEYDGRVKSLDRSNFVRILADSSNTAHLSELKKEGLGPIDLVIVDLYAPNEKTFPESMDIGGQALIRAAIKNYKNVAVAFDEDSIGELVLELKENNGSTTLEFRKTQAKKASKFIAERTKLEVDLFDKL